MKSAMKIIYIAGWGRSGSTVLGNVLACLLRPIPAFAGGLQQVNGMRLQIEVANDQAPPCRRVLR